MTQNNKLTCSKVAFKQYNVLDTKHQYLTPDYFLASSSSESYYSRKYSGSTNYHNLNHHSKYSKLLKVVSIWLVSLGVLATGVEAQPLDKNLSSALNPDDARAYNHKGISLVALGRNEEALEAYDKSLAFNPDYAELYNNKGISLSELGRNAEALEAFDKSLALKPNYTAAHHNKGVILAALGRDEEVRAVESTINSKKSEEDLQAGSSSLSGLEILDQEDGIKDPSTIARNLSSASADIVPQLPLPDLTPPLISTYSDSDSGYDDELLGDSGSSALSQKVTDGMIISLMDRVYTSGSESEAEEALEAYDKALALNPDFAEGYKKKGNSLYELGKYEEAEEALAVYEKALALNPDDSELSLDYEDDTRDDMGSSDREGLQEESIEILDHAVEKDSFTKDISTNVDSTACTERQEQSSAKEELLKKVYQVSTSQNHAREASKVVSKQIKHRMFMHDVQISAVAAGDEELGAITGYSVWSSGTLGNAKQRAKTTGSNGYITKIAGGTIGADVRFENDRLVGASLSKIRSNVKYEDQAASKKFDTYIVSMYGLNPIKENLTLGLIGSAGISGKPRSKLLNLESHLHYKIGLPQEVTLIPYIGFKYEYEKAAAHKEQIASDLSIARGKKGYQAFSTEGGSRIIFKAIKLNDDAASNTSLTPTAHFSVERKIGSRGASSPYSLTYQGIGQEAGTSILAINPQHSKTSFNTGIGLIASHKNISLECVYDMQKQRSFKSHQGLLKLKVNL